MATWLITGCSSGFGRALAEEALRRGDQVVATARDVVDVKHLTYRHGPAVLTLELDVADPYGVARAVADAQERFGPVDVLVAGTDHGPDDAAVDVLERFATHVVGPAGLVHAVLPDMRSRGRGVVVTVASDLRTDGADAATAGRFSLVEVATALRDDLAPHGVRVLVVDPGSTPPTAPGDLVRAARAVADAVADPTGPTRIAVGAPAHGAVAGA